MRGKKISVIVIILIVLAAGWFLSVRKASGVDERNAQNALVSEADGYAEKELYVRAIPIYRDALRCQTERTVEIEAKLLAAYKAHGDLLEYIDLAEKRIIAGTAKEDEYIFAADYYISHYQTDTAMTLVRQGIDRLGTQKLKDYFEENRYSYDIVITDYEKIMPTETNETMPAYDGTKWVYVDRSGRDKGIGVFDGAFAFNEDGYGVVEKNGKYYTILSDGDLYGVDELGASSVYGVSGSRILAAYGGKFSYYDYDFKSLTNGSHQYDAVSANHDGVAAVKSGEKWGVIKDNGETVADFVFEDMAVNSVGAAFAGGNAMAKISGKWYLIDTEGNPVFETGFCDAKAPEDASGYIAVANDFGKWGYADRNGRLVIDYRYDDAKSFSNALGAVMLGETWSYISEVGATVIDMSFEDAQPFHGGVAQAKAADGAVLIILGYFEE